MEIWSIRKKIETELWQRCRPFGLRDGDKNSHKKKKIESLLDANRIVRMDQEELSVVRSYYADMFTSSRPPIHMSSFDSISLRLTDDMHSILLKPYVKEEVVEELKGMHLGKSPSPDGFPAMFYNKFWDVIGSNVCDLVLRFLNHGGMPERINETHVLLIPKVKKPKEMKDLRSISLCNISYKLISKVLANRLKFILSDIIDDDQSAFIPGRLITDNALHASEVSHFMKTSLARKRGFMVLKIYMSKAYDRVEWDY
ncbi:unnamed protein product [Amaranthus hypochondriacus]